MPQPVAAPANDNVVFVPAHKVDGLTEAVPAAGVPVQSTAMFVQVKIPCGLRAALPPEIILSEFAVPAADDNQAVAAAFVRLLKSAFEAPRSPTSNSLSATVVADAYLNCMFPVVSYKII